MIFDGKPFDFNFLREKLKDLPFSLTAFKEQISAVILFGSMATGKETPLSDIDLAVLYRRNLSGAEIKRIHSQVYEGISDLLVSDDIDLINLNTAPLTMQYGTIKQSKLLILNCQEEYIDFWEQTVKHYLDFRPLLDECNNSLLDTLSGRAVHG